jgi:hypothetical protein
MMQIARPEFKANSGRDFPESDIRKERQNAYPEYNNTGTTACPVFR